MGSALEVGKLVCASWLKANWERAPRFMKYYMITAVMVLMLITSMGIFGFLSKAHNDQNLVSGDVQSRIAIYDEKIKIAKENIDANRKALKQLDEAVDQVMGRSTDEKGADKAVAIRRGQAKERTRLLQEITAEQKLVAQLNQERAPIAAEVRKVEAEVGPIKYIAKFIYGDKGADENFLERAVTWIIILIVIVFDPLAVIMLLAAQMTFGWNREQKKEVEEETPDPYVADVGEKPTEEEKQTVNEDPINWPFPTYEEITPKATNTFVDAGEHPKDNFEHDIEKEQQTDEPPMPLDQWNKMIAEAEKEVEKEKSAKATWKAEHPEDTIKRQELLKSAGVIENLPWEDTTQEEKEQIASTYKIFPELHQEVERNVPEPDFPKEDRVKPDLTEVIEPEDSKKKTYIVKEADHQVKKLRQ